MNRILLLPALGLAIGLDRDTAQTSAELAFDFSHYRDIALPATSGAWVWEGSVICDDDAFEVTYPGIVREARSADLALLATVGDLRQ